MALLCSALAFQAQFKSELEEEVENDAILGASQQPGGGSSEVRIITETRNHLEQDDLGTENEHRINVGEIDTPHRSKEDVHIDPSTCIDIGQCAKLETRLSVADHSELEQLEGDDDDFAKPVSFRDASWQNAGASSRVRRSSDEEPENANIPSQTPEELTRSREDFLEMLRRSANEAYFKSSLPRIFYASRTHAQIAQVVGELKKCKYRPRMVVLASRNEYCSHPVVRSQARKNEKCRALVLDNACSLCNRAMSVASTVRRKSPPEPMDIEDLNAVSSTVQGCSYYATTELYKSAELILCPYNYLIDPIVREARGIDVTGDIVIFDEAHNIEDHAREAASFSSDLSNLHATKDDLSEFILIERSRLSNKEIVESNKDIVASYQNVLDLLIGICLLADSVVEQGYLKPREDIEVATFEGQDMLRLFEGYNIDLEKVASCQNAIRTINESRDALNEILQERDPEDREGLDSYRRRPKFAPKRRRRRLGTQSSEADEQTCFSGGEDENLDSADESGTASTRSRDHEENSLAGISLAESLVSSLNFCLRHPESFVLAIKRSSNSWVSRVELNLWCLNAAIPFHAISSSARSVIVTSGTLAPANSFSGELGMRFDVAKSLPHVVNVRSQVFASIVASGPNDVKFDATYRGASSFEFQDSLGGALVSFCESIPGGVLVFLPSYRLLKVLVTRWKVSGIWSQIEKTKGAVYIEPVSRGDEFDQTILSYSSHANSSDGAILFGVCRGKISEGLDFKDAAARAVIAVGIPYPHSRCPHLLKKRAWNDKERLASNRLDLLSGDAWYDMQAFRPLNQALGRCVRHRLDYGAVILLDSRFRNHHVLRQLSSWVRTAVRPSDGTFESTIAGLREFFREVEH